MNYLKLFEEFTWDYGIDDKKLSRLQNISRERHKEIERKKEEKILRKKQKEEEKKEEEKTEKEEKRKKDKEDKDEYRVWDYGIDDEQLIRLQKFSRENHKEIKTNSEEKEQSKIRKKAARTNWTANKKEEKRKSNILNRKKASDLKKSNRQKDETELNEFKILVNNFIKYADKNNIDGCISAMKECKQLWKETTADKFDTPLHNLMKKLIGKYKSLDISIQNQIKKETE